MFPASPATYLQCGKTRNATAESLDGCLCNRSQGGLFMDKSSIGGVFLAVAGIVAGLLIEGGNLGQILQPTAALIVFGGTMGAVLLQFPLTTVASAFRGLIHVFSAPRR